MEDVLLDLIGWGLPLYVILQVWTLRRFAGRWRLAAAAPLALAVPLAVHALFALGAGSNLWPLLLIFFGPAGALFLLGLLAAHWALAAN